MTREVAALGGREFPPSMSDLKPGGLYSLSTLFLALGRGGIMRFRTKQCIGVNCAYLSFTGNIQYVSGFLMKGLKTPG